MALRMVKAKELLTSKEDYQVMLLISQSLAVRFIHHLTKELHAIETNTSHKVWLGALSDQLEEFYCRVFTHPEVA